MIIYKKGDFIESAMWFATPDEKQECKRSIRKAIEKCEEAMILAPVSWAEYSPDHKRCPDPPEGSEHGITLLVGEAEVLAIKEPPPVSRFVDNLEHKDLNLLRNITRSAHLKYNPDSDLLTDAQCDQIIESMGPEAAVKTMRAMH